MNKSDQGSSDLDSDMVADVHTTNSWQEKLSKAKNHLSNALKIKESEEQEFVVPLIAAAVVAFLSTCMDQGMDTKVDKSLLDRATCTSRLNILHEDKRNDLLQKLDNLLADTSIGEATWVDDVMEFMNDPFFQPQPLVVAGSSCETADEREAQERATIAAWEIPYEGELHDELWKHIKRLYAYETRHKDRYANMCAIIQSSGTGKSRMVDQLGTEHFVIPICLRRARTSGFPPADADVRQYLLESMRLLPTTPRQLNEPYAINRIDAFFSALFAITESRIEKIVLDIRPGNSNPRGMYREISATFRRLMTEGQSYEEPNDYRLGFYTEVINRALKLIGSPATDSAKRGTLGQAQAGKSLTNKLKSLQTKGSSELVFVIAFDESAMLTTRQDGSGNPPIFNTLRRRLNSLRAVPFFTLFLSTTGRIAPFLSPSGLPDGSARITERRLKLNPAFTGCIFDGFDAEKIALAEGEMTVQKAASEWTMMHLGRPLWATRVDKWTSEVAISRGEISTSALSTDDYDDAQAKFLVRRDAMRFVVIKLLNWTAIDDSWHITDDQMIACLCHRLPIEFQSTSPFQYRFVENHMRICVRLDPEDESMVSMSSSEPVLSEASFVVMKNRVDMIVPAMKIILGGFSVNKGDRGELVALLILLLARDEAVSRKNNEEMWKSVRLRDAASFSTEPPGYLRHPVEPTLLEWDRVFTVPDFLRALFGEIDGIQDVIDNTFKDTRMHFNHFIKCFQHSVLKRQYLSGLMMRGAALLCANCQAAVDVVTPFSFHDTISRILTSGIIFQIKNDPRYTDVPIWGLLDNMEQHSLGIVDKTTTYLPPVVRVFFALAASKPSITGRVTSVKVEGGKSYLAVDIWCAGINSDILPCIGGTSSRAQEAWNVLLDHSQGWNAPYIPPGEYRAKEFLRRMTPCLGEDPAFWKFSPDLNIDREEFAQPELYEMAKQVSQLNDLCSVERELDSDSATESNQASTSSDEANTARSGKEGRKVKRARKGAGKGTGKGNGKETGEETGEQKGLKGKGKAPARQSPRLKK